MADFFNAMVEAYEGDYNTMSDTELASGSLWSYLDPAYTVGVAHRPILWITFLAFREPATTACALWLLSWTLP